MFWYSSFECGLDLLTPFQHTKYAEVSVCTFQDQVMKDTAASTWLSLRPLPLGETQLPCHTHTQAALWKGPQEKELRPPANNHVNEPSWKWIFSPGQAFEWPQALPMSWMQHHERPWARVIRLSCFQFSNPLKLWHDKYFLF